MKKAFAITSLLVICFAFDAPAQNIFKKFKDKVKDKANAKVDQKVDNAATKTVDGADDILSGKKKTGSEGNSTGTTANSGSGTLPGVSSATDTGANANKAALKVYNNFDFIAGDTILFEDNFRDDQDGEFPSHWKLDGGQGVVNAEGDERFFAFTKYYTLISPLMKKKAYLPKDFTIEFDTYLDGGYDSNPGAYLAFMSGGDKIATLIPSSYQMDFYSNGVKLNGAYPKALSDNFHNNWHHIAIAVKGNQMKVYYDQYRVLVIPDKGFKAVSIAIGGDASEGLNMMFKNFKLASGAGMNMLGKKFTDTKIVTHGINFDFNKATIKPQSMGTLNGIVQILKDNPELRFEIGGHTDSDGENAYNMALSQQRAEAVRKQLVSMGITAERLTAKGYGENKPINNNTTPEGKADNRRVEFTKL